MALPRSEVEHVAKLANLELRPDEVESLAVQLGAIVDYVQQLGEVDTEGVEPTTFMTVSTMPLAEDRPREGLSQRAVIAAAPQSRDGAFAVPTFVDEG